MIEVGMRSALAIVGLSVAVLGCQASTDVAATGADQTAAKPAPPSPAAPARAVFDSSKAWEHLSQMVSIGPRPSGSAAIRQTRAYITRQLASYGLTVQEQNFVAQTPKGPIEMVNLIVRLPGRRTDRILFTGHYDTKLLAKFVGASDGASSAAFLIELARVLKDQPREYTYEFVWFDGEEAVVNWVKGVDSTYGSRYYVQAAKKANALTSIKAMILVDMIGDKNLTLRRESASTTWLKDVIWGTAKKLGYSSQFLDDATPIEDDHIPFLKAGVNAVDIIDLDYPAWHTAKDTIDSVAAGSLQIVGNVVVASLPEIEQRLLKN